MKCHKSDASRGQTGPVSVGLESEALSQMKSKSSSQYMPGPWDTMERQRACWCPQGVYAPVDRGLSSRNRGVVLTRGL